MAKAAEKAGRKQDGTFARGHSGNPAGKKKGTRHRTTLAVEALLHGEAERLTRSAINSALAGDMTALKICMDRIAPPLKERSFNFALPLIRDASDHAGAIAAVLDGLAHGELMPREAQAITTLLEQHRRSIALDELERRITRLEDK